MGRILVNPSDLESAAKLMQSARGELQLLARKVANDSMPEMPAAIAAQVLSGTGAASTNVLKRSEELEQVSGDLLRRARLAELTNSFDIALGSWGRLGRPYALGASQSWLASIGFGSFSTKPTKAGGKGKKAKVELEVTFFVYTNPVDRKWPLAPKTNGKWTWTSVNGAGPNYPRAVIWGPKGKKSKLGSQKVSWVYDDTNTTAKDGHTNDRKMIREAYTTSGGHKGIVFMAAPSNNNSYKG